MNLWKWINKIEPKYKKLKEHAIIASFGALVFWIINILLIQPKSNQANNTPKTEKEQTIQNYKILTDSLLTEIKQKELIIQDFELAAHKDSILKNEND